MAERVLENDSSKVETKDIGQEIDAMIKQAESQRRIFGRQCYDNNFFDDGHHYRYLSRATGRLVDLSDSANLYSPKRAIPKASRQIRGMANLMLSQDFKPQVLPDKLNVYAYPDPEQYKQAWNIVKQNAKRKGQWLENEWENQDLTIKLALMVLLTMKNKISYLQVWPDPVEEAIRTQVYDFFDIYLDSAVTEIYDSPYLIKVAPKSIKEIKANENFDEDQLNKISPDNRYASDEIKEAYMASKFGKDTGHSDSTATLLLKEAFLKEYINDSNIERIRSQDDGGEILKERKKGDPIIRQIFSAGGYWLRDEYLTLSKYPFVDFRMEPGPIYQVAQIERFIPANKSLDEIMSRLETYIHTMNVGVWLKRTGEGFRPTNVGGGQIIEYDQSKPEQMALSPVPGYVFNFLQLLTGFIEEQGVTTSALGKVPEGVKAWGAIESLKASEFSNLYIPIQQLKKTIQRISEKMIDIAATNFVSPQTVMNMDRRGNPDYFDIIGEAGVMARKKIKEQVSSDIVPINKDTKVKIVVESGLGYTEEGKKGRMMELANFLIQLGQQGLLSPDAVKLVVERLLEVFKFGPTAEMMEAMDQIPSQPTNQFSPEQQAQVKTAMLEVIRDLQQAEAGGAVAPTGQATQAAPQPQPMGGV